MHSLKAVVRINTFGTLFNPTFRDIVKESYEIYRNDR